MALKWLFLDMNAFFASVEQQENPRLRGKPVAVVPVMSDSTCCIAASYEAKRFGIKTGTNVGEARRLCPHLILIETTSHSHYREYHNAIVNVVESCLPVTEIWSVDEMVCKLWANEKRAEDALALGQKIKSEIFRNVGEQMCCSVGLSLNPFLAKVAGELQKPNGLVALDEEDLPHRLYKLKLTDFPGINRSMEARFHAAGVRTTEHMCALSQEQMRRVWGGVMGEYWWRQLRGEYVQRPTNERRSVSHTHVMPPELRTPAGAAAVQCRLLEKAAERMRGLGFYARGMGVFARGVAHDKWENHCRFAPCADTWTLMEIMQSLFHHPFRQPKQVGVALYDLVPVKNVTGSLFDDYERRWRLSVAMDGINQRFGRHTITMASSRRAETAKEDKIAFGKIAEIV
ncbi:DNA polymerase IV [Capsulimonas corticalis]|uniref:DNA polymerase IV n=1 Tax=Capsulimonas corticalis TaxID=2219043 RepID=A0A402CXP0_9BACT|nr:DNA polymerase [Capsulimonas corticalis]BDI32223.1 DNA polymerase IV [Capsulimonas corticalis]